LKTQSELPIMVNNHHKKHAWTVREQKYLCEMRQGCEASQAVRKHTRAGHALLAESRVLFHRSLEPGVDALGKVSDLL
jgi:hypothetical protein